MDDSVWLNERTKEFQFFFFSPTYFSLVHDIYVTDRVCVCVCVIVGFVCLMFYVDEQKQKTEKKMKMKRKEF